MDEREAAIVTKVIEVVLSRDLSDDSCETRTNRSFQLSQLVWRFVPLVTAFISCLIWCLVHGKHFQNPKAIISGRTRRCSTASCWLADFIALRVLTIASRRSISFESLLAVHFGYMSCMWLTASKITACLSPGEHRFCWMVDHLAVSSVAMPMLVLYSKAIFKGDAYSSSQLHRPTQVAMLCALMQA